MAKLLTFIITLSALLALLQPASAAMSDEDYVTHAFGTVLVLHTPRQVINPEQGWWGDKVHKDLQNPSYLIGIVNSQRMQKKVTPLLDPNDGAAILFDIEETEGSGYRYTIDFAGQRPSEVQALVDLLGGPGKVLQGATSATYEPLQRRSIYSSSTGGAPITLVIGTTKIETSPDMDFADVRGRVDKALQSMFGKQVPFDFTVTRSVFMDGTDTADVSVYVDLNPPPPPSPEEMSEEQGE
jgi:hypothetical protein